MTTQISRVIVGSDGSDRAGRAVARAVEVAAALGGALTVLGVGTASKLRPLLERQVEEHGDSGVAIDIRVESGHPATVIAEIAEREGYDLLVLGNKGMSGLERLRLGSVPNKVSHHLPCSLLIVRTGS
ncbi:MAG TPA: universal stress protein [Acidimicrobiia bacterium]|nr:universal stress protein [Acidimicrobiia bacterium]